MELRVKKRKERQGIRVSKFDDVDYFFERKAEPHEKRIGHEIHDPMRANGGIPLMSQRDLPRGNL